MPAVKTPDMDEASFLLAASTADLADVTEPAVQTYADALEFRMDLATEPLAALAAYDGELPIIATNRVVSEGGKAPDTDRRIDRLEAAAEHDAVTAIDIERATVENRRQPAVPDGTDRIVSTHDFERTPDGDTQHALLEAALEMGDIGKLAVMAHEPTDVLSLLTTTATFATRGATVATMAMGPLGRHSRAIAPLYGSTIGYAPVETDRTTAPGQYDIETLANLINRLRPTSEGS